jgi:hypothetical protein
MPAQFSVDAVRSTFELRTETKEQIKALMFDLDMDAKSVIEMAVAQLHARELGEEARDWLEELDELKQRVAALEAAASL